MRHFSIGNSLLVLFRLHPRVVSWITTFTGFFSGQIVAQAIGFACGILLVRTLTREEYALYTIATTLQGAMSAIADTGINSAMLARGGQIWQDSNRLRQLINSGMRFRSFLTIAAVISVTPFLFWMLISNGSPAFYAAAIWLVILAGLYCQLSNEILGLVPRLHSQLSRLQRLSIGFSIVRFALIALALAANLNTFTAILAATLAAGAQCVILTRWVNSDIGTHSATTNDDQRYIAGIVKSQILRQIFYCLQGSITVWLITIFGNAQSVADLGALGRFGQIFTALGATVTAVLLPSYAKCHDPQLLKRFYLQIIGALILLSASLVGASIHFQTQLLWILGSNYSHLGNELTYIILNSCCFFAATTLWNVNTSKAWIREAWLIIPTTLSTQGILLLILEVSTVRGALLFSTLSLLPGLALNLFMAHRGLALEQKLNSHALVPMKSIRVSACDISRR